MLGNKKLVYEFFYTFSRFEFALKSVKFLKQDNGNAEASWDKFAKSIDKDIKDISKYDSEFKKSVEYFSNNPPAKQIVSDSVLDFKKSKKPENFEELLKLVRIVRNNLFHGGKFPSGPISDAARNDNLIKHSLTILKTCLEFNQSVKNKFNEGN